MGQAKQRQKEGFTLTLIEQWEADDCVNFAIALARMTGWPLHVDWYSPRQEDVTEAEMIPLRVYVADNKEGVFDVRGVKTLNAFMSGTTTRIAKQRARGYGGVLTRYYSEEKLMRLPLRCSPEESKIAEAAEAIRLNTAFLKDIPSRPASGIPGHDAARYTFGRCAVYAEAMRELHGLRPVAILGKRFAPPYDKHQHRSEDGYVHSAVLHPDGQGEDAWGIASIADIAARFGAVEFELSEEVHKEVIANFHRNSLDRYESELLTARNLIARYRLA